MKSKHISLVLSLLSLAQTSAAVIYSETHSITTDSPTTDRNIYNNGSLLSIFGNISRRFDFTTFTVSATGTYMFLDTGDGTIGNTVVGIYSSAFDVSDLSIGLLAGNDDGGAISGPFLLLLSLTSGQTYTIVTGPFGDVDGEMSSEVAPDPLGDIVWEVSGPNGATLTPVPEPESMVIISAGGLLGIAAWRRGTRRK